MNNTNSDNDFIYELLKWENKFWATNKKYIAGIDEAGRGPLAGPVVAAAVVFLPDFIRFFVNDSKKLSATKREKIFNLIKQNALSVGIGICHEKVIDSINILQATYKAMNDAIVNLSINPHHILVDGRAIPKTNVNQTAIVKGDQKCFSIAAASIIAKVTRDRMMVEYDKKYPQYGFAQHKGYGTKKHIEAIMEFGPCPIHRLSFKLKNK